MSGILPHWIERLLGLDAPSGEGTVWRLDGSWGIAPWITLLLAALAIGLIVYCYVREAPASGGRKMKGLLAAIRLSLVAIITFMLAGVMITFQRTGLPYVVVLVDDSASMTIADRYSDKELDERLKARLKKAGFDEASRINLAKMLLLENDADLLRRIEERYRLKLYFLSGSERAGPSELRELADAVRGASAEGTTSQLGKGLRTVLADLRGTPPAAIILLSDGVTTEGEPLGEAAAYARRKGVPIFPIGLGSDEAVRDIELGDLLVDEMVFVDDVVQFQASLRSAGYAGQEVEIVLKEKGNSKVLARTRVRLTDDGKPQKIRLPHRPEKEGEFEYIVEVETLPDEVHADNNRRGRTVAVRKAEVRVLLVQAYPNYEFRYLKSMLERDSTIQLRTVLTEADLEYAQIDKSALRVFPVRKDELFEYDVIIFGDVNPADLSVSSGVMENLRDFVEKRGGGIVFIAGPQFTPTAYSSTPIAGLFPIDVGTVIVPPSDKILAQGFPVQPTPLGLESPTMQLGDTPEETARIWRNLPHLYWMLEAANVKPAARVLAENPNRTGPDGRYLPVILMQYVGAGKVVMHATDETWRWRYQVGDVFFARYWIQTIRYLARAKLLEGDRAAELTVDRAEGYRRGEPVRIRARFFDDRKAPAADDGVTVVVQRAGSQDLRLTLRRDAIHRGVFEGVFTPSAEGKHNVWMAVPTAEGRAPSTTFAVSAPPGEFERPRMDVAELSRAAEVSQGKFYRVAATEKLVADLPAGRQVPIETLPPEVLWNRWWLLLLFLGLLVTEWVLRKRVGLV